MKKWDKIRNSIKNPTFIQDCIIKAEKGESNLNKQCLKIKGMSSNKVRHLLNNIVSKENSRYVEVGLNKGSTFISALSNNDPEIAIGIDNWTNHCTKETPGLFFNNKKRLLGSNKNIHIFEQDFRDVDLSELAPLNVYFYDGDHSKKSQMDAFKYMKKYLDDEFIVIIDDFNLHKVKEGTNKMLKKFIELEGYKITSKKRNAQTWWNGLYVGLLQKRVDKPVESLKL